MSWTDERVDHLKKLWSDGLSASQIAAELGVSEITVKVHRGQVMRKMQAASLPELARMADTLNLTREQSRSC